jgi:hypothetical protein
MSVVFPLADRTKARAINRCGELAKDTPPPKRALPERNRPADPARRLRYAAGNNLTRS